MKTHKLISPAKINLNLKVINFDKEFKKHKLSSQVDKEARGYFKEKVYHSVIPRNVRLSEAPSHGQPCVTYDRSCSGSKAYFKFTEEFLAQDKQVETAAW